MYVGLLFPPNFMSYSVKYVTYIYEKKNEILFEIYNILAENCILI